MESFNNFIAESFDEKNTYEIISVEQTPDDDYYRHRGESPRKFKKSTEDKTIKYKIKSDNGTYFNVFYQTKWNAKNWDWELTFSNNRKDDDIYLKTHDIMGGFETKEVIKISNTVIKTIHDMTKKRVKVEGVTRNYIVNSINFQATVKESSRVKLYKRMFKRFTSQLNNFWLKSSVDEKPNGDDLVYFKIERTTEEDRDKILRKREEEDKKEEKKSEKKEEDKKEEDK